MSKKNTLNILSVAMLAAFSSGAYAAGFALQNQNGSGNGNAFAGAAAAAEDAGTIFFNPAGMTYLPQGNNVALAATVLNRSIDFTNTGTAPNLNPTVTATNGGDGGGTALIPAGYWSMSMSPNLYLGLGVSPTFGNTTEYTTDFYGRYSGYYAEMKQININPSIAYKLNEAVSLGFGLNYAKNETEFRQMAPVFALSSGAFSDRSVTLKGDDTSWGYNLGAMLKLSDAARVGLAYRSKIKFELEGTQTTSGAALPGALGVALPQSVAVKANLETPDSFSVAYSYDLTKQLQLLADLTWTGWSSIKQIPVTRADGVAHPGLAYNFDDTYRFGLGMNYTMDTRWKLRAGVAYDQTPVQGPADTTMTLPDSDRTWLSVGAKYTLSAANSIDVGYTHIFFDKATTTRAVKNSAGATVQTIRGDFETSADLLSLQYNHNF